MRTASPNITEHELAEIRAFIEARTGILFDASRERFFSTRVREHAEEKRLAHGADLLRLIKGSNVEYERLLQRLLTQETSFFRYPDLYAALERRVLPELHAKKFWESPRTLRIWSAGCSTGEEPYSIAITVADSLRFAEAWNVNILASDISRDALEIAERGVYSQRALARLTPKQRETYFAQVADQFAARPKLRSLVSFLPMNLSQAVYLGRFDCIFCMNVLIYFSEEKKAELLQRFWDSLEPGGYLFLGHAETAVHASVKFDVHVIGDSRVYQKPAPLARPVGAAAVTQEWM